MNTTKLKFLFLGVALAFSTPLVGHAQSSTEQIPATQHAEAAKGSHREDLATSGVRPLLSPGSYSDYCAYHFNGSGVIINCSDWRINANSRVVASMSEYATNPGTDRFIGAARMTVHNVRPYNGGFNAWVDVEWWYPINVRVDFFVEP